MFGLQSSPDTGACWQTGQDSERSREPKQFSDRAESVGAQWLTWEADVRVATRQLHCIDGQLVAICASKLGRDAVDSEGAVSRQHGAKPDIVKAEFILGKLKSGGI